MFVCRFVDNEILSILRRRFEDCVLYESPDHKVKCQPLFDQYNEAAENWFIKCKYFYFRHVYNECK
jgi:NADH dehydrogenase (ubiquinone) 1 beta subcomplex subunit 10